MDRSSVGCVGFFEIGNTTPCSCVERLERERDSACDSLCTLIGRGSAGMGVRLRTFVNYCALKVKFTCIDRSILSAIID